MENLTSVFTIEFFYAIIRIASPIILAAMGEVLLEKAGIFNLGLEGMMLFGAFFGVLGSYLFGSAVGGIFFAILIGIVLGLLFGWAVISIRANQAVTGTAINILALGMTSLLARLVWGVMDVPLAVDSISVVPIPLLHRIPLVGHIIFDHSPMVYLSYLSIGVVYYLLYKTTWGLKIRAIGEHPKAAVTMGIEVIRWKYIICIVSSVFASLSGSILSLSFMNLFVENMSAGRGFMAIASVILGRWHPIGIALGGLLFGFGTALQMRLQSFGIPIPTDLLLVFPVLLALIVVLVVRGSSSARPAALAKPFYKEQ